MVSLIIQAYLALAFTAVLSRRVNGTLVGGVTAFWAAWAFMLTAALISVEFGMQIAPQELALEYAQEGFVGAFLGSVAGILAAGNARQRIRGTRRWTEFALVSEFILQRALTVVALGTAILGLAHFVDRWQLVDFDFFRIQELRVAVLSERDPGLLYRATSYIQVLTGFMAMLAGTADAEFGVRPRRIVIIWLSMILPGLALGGRGWTLAPQLIYALSHFVSRQCSAARRPSLRAYAPILVLVALGFWAFTVIGTVRNRDLNRDQAESLTVSNWDIEQRLMTVGYVGGSLAALGTMGRAAEQAGPAYGEAVFEYFTRKAIAFGLPFGAKSMLLERWRTEDMPTEPEYGWTWCVPPTAMAYLLLDFGRVGMPLALGILVAFGHYLSVRWVGQGIFRHLAAVLALNGMFASPQNLVVFNTLNVVILLFAALAALAVRPLVAGLASRPASGRVGLGAQAGTAKA